MITEIQAIVERQIKALSLCNITVGKIRSLSPLEVELANGIVLKKGELLLCGTILPREIDTNHIHAVAMESGVAYSGAPIPGLTEITIAGYALGDPVLLIKATGGQKYAMVSKLVEL